MGRQPNEPWRPPPVVRSAGRRRMPRLRLSLQSVALALARIAAHTTCWTPFGQLGSGDTIALETRAATYRYRVTGTRVVDANDNSVLVPGDGHSLVLTTCWPLWAGNLAPQRLAIFATQV